jgi:hypothetical protein
LNNEEFMALLYNYITMLIKLNRSVNSEYVEEDGLSWNYYDEAEVIHEKCE